MYTIILRKYANGNKINIFDCRYNFSYEGKINNKQLCKCVPPSPTCQQYKNKDSILSFMVIVYIY